MAQYVWVFQNVIPPKGTKKWRGPFVITEIHKQGIFYRLSEVRAAHYEKLKPLFPSPEEWFVPQNIKGLEYLIVKPACEVNEKGTREKSDGNEISSLGEKERIDVYSDEEVSKSVKPCKLMAMEMRKSGRKKTSMTYKSYGEDFLIDKIKPDEIGAEMVSVGELVPDQESQIIDDDESSWQENHSVPEREMNPE